MKILKFNNFYPNCYAQNEILKFNDFDPRDWNYGNLKISQCSKDPDKFWDEVIKKYSFWLKRDSHGHNNECYRKQWYIQPKDRRYPYECCYAGLYCKYMNEKTLQFKGKD